VTTVLKKSVGGNKGWAVIPNLWMRCYDRTLDIHTIPSTVYPPMSRGVLALTFLRSTSQGVDVASCSFTGSLPYRWCFCDLSVLLLSLLPILIIYSAN